MSDLFDPTDAQVVLDDSKDYVSELVGEGKKFSTVADLAKGKAFSDLHISNLERTLNSMREELQTRKTAEELINQISQSRKPVAVENIPDPLVVNPDNTPIKSGLSAEDVEKLLQSREAQRSKESNLKLVSQKMEETFGTTSSAVLQQKATELGVSLPYLKDMAQSAPNAFLALFSKAKTEITLFQPTSTTTYRPPVQSPMGEKWSDFNKVKVSDSKLYWSPAFQRKVAEAAQRATDAGRSEEFYRS